MDTDGFPLQFARTRRFSLGIPRDFTVSPDGDRVLFLRSVSGADPRSLLWMYEKGEERILADSAGLVAYAADREARVVAYAADGVLWTVRTDGSEPRRVPSAGPVDDPRPSPDGSLIAYVTGGALHVVRTDGTRDLSLAEPEADEVSYGLDDNAATFIGRSRGYWWSPDSDALLMTRVDTSMVERRYVGDPSHPTRPPRSIRYPAAGTANAHTTLHLVTTAGVRTPVRLPQQAPDAPGAWGRAFEYVVRADWQSVGPVASVQTRDQRTMWVVRVDPATGDVEPVSRQSDDAWVEFPPGAPLHTHSGVPVLPQVRGDARTIRIGDAVAPPGLQVREVLGAVGERVLFTASEEPTEVHVWSYEPGRGFEQLTREPGVHTAAAGGDTLVLDSSTPEGRTVTVLRSGKPVGRIGVLAERPSVPSREVHLVLGERQLRSRLHLPSWYEPGSGKLPVLLNPYAGPGMQVVTKGHRWDAAVCQWYAEQGFAVLATDGRGTPGRGVRWQQEILGDRLGPVLADQIDALHAAAERCDAMDLDRVGIRGWSFSGYVAAGAVLHRPDVFHAAVAGAPPTDRRLYHSYWEERFLGHPDLHPDNYERSSLLPVAGKLTRPLLLIHGLVDENVAPAHTLRLSAALLAAGRPHSVLLLPGVGHLIARPGVADTQLRFQLDFLKRSLGGTAAS
jgi:dipeptidyl-peptidase-4